MECLCDPAGFVTLTAGAPLQRSNICDMGSVDLEQHYMGGGRIVVLHSRNCTLNTAALD